MKQEHMNALAVHGTSGSLTHNGVDLWTNGHILVRGKVEGSKGCDLIAKVWDGAVLRAGELPAVSLGPIHSGRAGYSREMWSEHGSVAVFINEAYRVALSEDGSVPYIVSAKNPVCFRKNGELTAVCMPMTQQSGDQSTHDPTEADLFESFACAENNWYLQGATALRRELSEVERDIETLEERIQEADSDLSRKQDYADGLRKRISAAKTQQAGGTHAPQGKQE